MDAERFFKTLFHDKPDSEFILIWEKRDNKKVSYWFNETSKAIEHFNQTGQKQDTYVGCGTSLTALSQFRRCKAEEISGIAGAWLDVDILNPVHSKTNLPETKFKALEVIKAFPLSPTIVIHSGHGYQFWWVFRDFWKFNNQVDHMNAAKLLREFTSAMRDNARTMGYELDMTFDLSRVFRIPGGKNHKDKPPLPVIMEECSEDYYMVEEFQDALDELKAQLGPNLTPIDQVGGQAKAGSSTASTFIIDPNAEPPMDKLEILLALDSRFKATWEHKSRGFKTGDTSPSAYDMSLASFTTMAGWSRQEIIDLLIAFRRRHGLPPKLVEDYYRRTCDKAENALYERKKFDELSDILADNALAAIDPDTSTAEAEEKRKKAVQAAKDCLSAILKINFIKILEFDIHPPEYKIVTDYVSFLVGGIDSLVEQRVFGKRFAEAFKKNIPTMDKQKWLKVSDALLALCEKTSAGEDTSTIGTVRSWLQGFLAHHTPLYDAQEAISSHRPFFMGDSLYLSGPDLRHYVGLHENEVINRKAMGIMLREYGFIPLTINIRGDGRYFSRSLWKIEIAKDAVAQSFVNDSILRNANENASANDDTDQPAAIPQQPESAYQETFH